ncbi:hypothetical protein CYMTET_44956 [Cymbomonas tetramitiformis]|uniref:Uncharacterized protein n=1 Tax=Cymbomonas tetramitiformis TaxID=36881 RepID=A0AAE0BZ64_9CHLO|nr:hypothetical protein CYMTET_44956 [Cymbomonas tetramitiformis]
MPGTRLTHLTTQDTITFRAFVEKENGIALQSQTQYFDRDKGRWMDRSAPLSDSVGKYLNMKKHQYNSGREMAEIAGFSRPVTRNPIKDEDSLDVFIKQPTA